MTKGKNGRGAVLRALKRLARGRANDVVKLAYLSEEQMAEIDGLDLTALVEFKRHGNGAVELKLVDRAAVLERILELEGGAESTESFLKVLAQPEGKE